MRVFSNVESYLLR